MVAGVPIRAISFDLFDTLVDLGPVTPAELEDSARAMYELARRHLELDFAAFREVLMDVSRKLTAARYAEGREVPTLERFAAVAERLGIADESLPVAWTDLHMGMIESKVRVPDHHGRVLDALAERVPLALCSNFTHSPTAVGILDQSQLGDRLGVVVISDRVGWRKPYEPIFRALLAALGTKPEETLHVGDNLRADVGGAAALGMQTAWITRVFDDPDEIAARYDGPPPDHVVSDLSDLVRVIA